MERIRINTKLSDNQLFEFDVDFNDSSGFSLNKALYSLFDPEQIRTDFTKTIELPSTPHNDTLLGSFKSIVNKVDFDLFEFFIVNIQYGSLFLLTGDMNLVEYDHINAIYRMQISGIIGSVKTVLGNKSLADIDTYDDNWNHISTLQNVIDSWLPTNDPNVLLSGRVRYPITDNGQGYGFFTKVPSVGGVPQSDAIWDVSQQATPILFEKLRPAVNVINMLTDILYSNGFEYDFKFLQDSIVSELTDNYVLLPYNDGAADIDSLIGEFRGVAKTGNHVTVPTDGSKLVLSMLEDEIINMTFNPTTNTLTLPNDPTNLSTYLDFTLRVNNTSISLPSGNLHFQVGNETPDIMPFDKILWLDANPYKNGLARIKAKNILAASESVQFKIWITDLDAATTAPAYDGSTLGLHAQARNSESINQDIFARYMGATTQFDFLNSFITHFGLVLTQSYGTNIITIQTYPQLVASNDVIDITNKIDYIDSFGLESITAYMPRLIEYKYKDPSSYLNESIKDNSNLNYSDLVIDLGLSVMQGSKEVNINYAPSMITSIKLTGNVDGTAVLMRNFKDVKRPTGGDQSMNFFVFKGVNTGMSYYIRDEELNSILQTSWPKISMVTDNGYFTGIRYQRGYESIDYDTVTSDVFNTCMKQKYSEWIGLDYLFTSDGGLATIDNDALLATKVINVDLWINGEDYVNFDFSKRYRISNSYGTADFRLLSIDNFDPLGRNPAKMKLVKIVK